jgi:hypothetical protein
MNCAQCRERFDDYIRGFLTVEDSLQIKSHLEHCSACNKEYESLAALFRVLDKGSDLSVKPGELADFMPEIWSKIEATKKPKFSKLGRLVPIISTVAVLAVMFFRPGLQSFWVTERNGDYGRTAAVYDSTQYNQKTYLGLLRSLFADENAQMLEIAERELDTGLGVIFSGSFINELDNFTDEGLEAINQKLSELRGTEG